MLALAAPHKLRRTLLPRTRKAQPQLTCNSRPRAAAQQQQNFEEGSVSIGTTLAAPATWCWETKDTDVRAVAALACLGGDIYVTIAMVPAGKTALAYPALPPEACLNVHASLPRALGGLP